MPEQPPLKPSPRSTQPPIDPAAIGALLALPAPTIESRYLTMRDGVRVAIDVTLPADLPASGRVPTVLTGTRYWRSASGSPAAEMLREITSRKLTSLGVAYVCVDARGTGASFGQWRNLWSSEEMADLAQVVDWVVEQPWSDGTVGSTGASYPGITAHLLAAIGHPAVKAVVPRFATLDIYGHGAFPGGVPCDVILRAWTALNTYLDHLEVTADFTDLALDQVMTGLVRPVDDDPDGLLVAEARRDRADNLSVWTVGREATFRDDMRGTDGVPIDDNSPMANVTAIADGKVPVWLVNGWYDGGFAASALAQVNRSDLNVQVTIGPWAHGAMHPNHGSPFLPDAPLEVDPITQLEETIEFIRAGCQGQAEVPGPRLRYYTIGEEAWHTAQSWPPEGVVPQPWFLGAGGSLTGELAETSEVDSYSVDFTATTGVLNRWRTIVGATPAIYGDRAAADERLLVYTSEPLDADLEITGSPVATLFLATDHDDGAVFAYLEDVAPDGRVTYLTEGELRFVHRQVRDHTAELGLHHSYREADALPVLPNELMELTIDLFPISALIAAGHSVRLALAGADADSFRRLPTTGQPTWQLHRSPDAPSRIDLPVRRGRHAG